MNLSVRTLNCVLDCFQSQEGIWRSTLQLSYQDIYRTLEEAQLGFAEWDPDRGLYYLDFTAPGDDGITIDLTLLDFEGERGTDHYRFEWTAAKNLGGVELQTHAPGPLPLLPEIHRWLYPDLENRSPPLSLEAWEQYLSTLRPLNAR